MELPEELLEKISLYLDSDSLIQFATTCKTTRRIATGEHFLLKFEKRHGYGELRAKIERSFPLQLLDLLAFQRGCPKSYIHYLRWWAVNNAVHLVTVPIGRNSIFIPGTVPPLYDWRRKLIPRHDYVLKQTAKFRERERVLEHRIIR